MRSPSAKCSRCLRKIPAGQRYCNACLREMAENDRRAGNSYVRSTRTYMPDSMPRPTPPAYPSPARRKKRRRAAFRQAILLLAALVLVVSVVVAIGGVLHRFRQDGEQGEPLPDASQSVMQQNRPQNTDTEDPGDLPAELPENGTDAPEAVQPSQPPEEPAPDVRQQAAEIIPYFSQRWLLQQVEEDVLADFLTLYQAICSFTDKCYLSDSADSERVEQLFFLVRQECPEIFQLESDTRYTIWSRGGTLQYVEIHYDMTREEYQAQLAACQQKVAEITANTAGLSQWDRELYAYEYITAHCVYDAEAADAGSAYGALVQGRAKCDGISRAMKWLAEEMGMTCLMLSGDPVNPATPDAAGHAWNCIQIDGQFYDLDVTADTPRSQEELCRHYSGFNVSRELLTRLYTLREGFLAFDLPGTDSMEGSWHAKNGSLFSSCGGWEAVLEDLYTQVQQSGEGVVRMQFVPVELVTQAREQLQQEIRQWQRSQSYSSQLSSSLREDHGSLWIRLQKTE